jgi:hypothetical protein
MRAATTPAGKAMFQMMGVFAEFERAMINRNRNQGHYSQVYLPGYSKLRRNAMTYLEPSVEGNRRRLRMRDLTIGQCLGVVGGACAVVLGMYFLFSLL